MELKLFIVLLGCKPKNRNTEQHDVFFGIGESLKDLIPKMKNFWPEGEKNMHIDAWMVVEHVNHNNIIIRKKLNGKSTENNAKLFFINLGGYKPEEFEEYHKKILVVDWDISKAIKQAKDDIFYEEVQLGSSEARSHIDDKHQIDFDTDDILNVSEEIDKLGYEIIIKSSCLCFYPDIHLGYQKFEKIIEE